MTMPTVRRTRSRLAAARRVLAALTLLPALGGCFGPESIATGNLLGGRGAGPAEASLLVATTRRPMEGRPWFGAERGRSLSFAQARLTPPDRSLVGRVAAAVGGGWAVASVGPATEAGAAEAFAGAALGRDVLLYVHGYRETFETAAVSAAELADGIGFRGLGAVFAWPSGGATFDYGYDRESALWSRDAFEDLLLALARTDSGGRVHLVAHSMGSLLTLETLRMVRAAGGDAAMARIGSVTLAAPDVDIDQFLRAVERLGPDARKITVISATNDRALAVSRRLAGGVARAGAAEREKLAVLEPYGVRIADASDFGSGVLNHDLFLSNEEVRGVVKRAIERAGSVSPS